MKAVFVIHGVFSNCQISSIVTESLPDGFLFKDVILEVLSGLHPSFHPVCRLVHVEESCYVISIDLGFFGVEETDENKKLSTLNTGLPFDSHYCKTSDVLGKESHPFKNYLLFALSRRGQLL